MTRTITLDEILDDLQGMLDSVGASHRKLGKRIDVSERTIRRWIHKKSKPRRDNANAIVKFFNEEYDAVLGGSASLSRQIEITQAELTASQNENRRLALENAELQAILSESRGALQDAEIEKGYLRNKLKALYDAYENLKNCPWVWVSKAVKNISTSKEVLKGAKEEFQSEDLQPHSLTAA